MSWFYRHVARPLLFAQDSEVAHDRTLRGLALAGRSRFLCALTEALCDVPDLPVQVFGLRFPNPVGLAAGMDKSAEAVPMWRAMGFGFSELGGVTWHPQPGNPRPRMFRVVSEEALVNRMGFNNAGASALAGRLREWRERDQWPGHPVGINLGKSKVTPLDRAADDYADSFATLHPWADFFVVNVSSPNTPGLRKLQDRAALDEILAALQERNRPDAGRRRVETGSRFETAADAPVAPPSGAKPLLVKVAPDLSFEALDEIVEVALRRNLTGTIATNTTVSRPETADPVAAQLYQETGGLSGKPLRIRSTEVVRHLYRQAGGRLAIVGVGGIANAADAWEKITAGASLVQIYSALVYEGPFFVREIVSGILERLAGARWEEAVGSGPSSS